MTFLDTSLLLRVELDEEGAEEVSARLAREPRIVLCALARVEFESVLARRRRAGTLAPSVADAVEERFRARWAQAEVVPLDETVLEAAVRAARKHALRSLDSLQLGAAISFAEGAPSVVRFGSFDSRLNAAAKAEGLALLLQE